MQGRPNLVIIGAAEVGECLAVPHAFLKHAIRALSGTFDQAATCKSLCDAAVARQLLIEYVLCRDAGWKAAGAHDLDPAGGLTNEHRAGMAVVAMADRVQDALAHGGLAEGGYGMHDHAVLKMLLIVPQVDELPEPVIEQQEPLAELFALVGRTGPGRRAILENDFGL